MENGTWIDKELSSKVLTIGCKYIPPRGGIAQVLWNYDNFIFEDFKFIENSRNSNAFINLFVAIVAINKMIIKLLIDKKIKIVHIHTASKVSFLRSTMFLKVAKFFKKKVVMHIHGGGFKDYYNKHERFVKKNLRKCDKIITLSEEWVNFYFSIGFESIFVENIIQEPVILPSQISDGIVHMLYLGLIVERKGIYDLLDVMSSHRQEFEGKLILHIGGNGEIEKLQKIIKHQNLDNLIKYEGWVDNEKKIELLNLCDVFVLPSYVEGLPLSILEAMSYDLSIISTPVGGIPSLVHDKENGLLFKAGDRNGLYNAINSLIIKDFVLKPNSDMVKCYYPQSVVKKLTKIYKTII